MALPLHSSVLLALVAALSCAALPAHAAMFKWVDESGSVTYSNTPPQDPGKVTDLVTIEEPAPPKPIEPAAAARRPIRETRAGSATRRHGEA